jgi:AcrR family transcriptional regulator
MSRPARLKLEVEHIREDILHAAGRAFSRQGFDHVTIHDIAKEAGYTTPSLYAYFKGKQDIIDALTAAVRQEIRNAFDADPPRDLNFCERLSFLFEQFIGVCERWPEARLLILELKRLGNTRPNQTKPSATRQSLDARLIEWLNSNVTNPKDIGGRKPEEIVHIIRSLIIGAFLPGDCKTDHCNTPRERFTLALQVCLYGLGGTGPASRQRKDG